MRKHTRKIKSRRRGGSRRLRGGNPVARFFGFGKPSVTPEQAQAQMSEMAEEDQEKKHTADESSKKQQAQDLENQCNNWEARARELNAEAAQSGILAKRVRDSITEKNRCNNELKLALQGSEEDYNLAVQNAKQEHDAAVQRAKDAQDATAAQANAKHQQCLQQRLRLSQEPIAEAQQQEARMDAAATRLTAQRRGQLDRRSVMGDAARRDMERARAAAADAAARGSDVRIGGRRRRKSRRRGGTGCGTYKKKMMRAGRKSRRGGAHCSPKSGKNCPYYKKYGYHKM